MARKALSNKYSDRITVIERADWRVEFLDPMTGRRQTRTVWWGILSSDMYVEYNGRFVEVRSSEVFHERVTASEYSEMDLGEVSALAERAIAHRDYDLDAERYSWEELSQLRAFAVLVLGLSPYTDPFELVRIAVEEFAVDTLDEDEAETAVLDAGDGGELAVVRTDLVARSLADRPELGIRRGVEYPVWEEADPEAAPDEGRRVQWVRTDEEGHWRQVYVDRGLAGLLGGAGEISRVWGPAREVARTA